MVEWRKYEISFGNRNSKKMECVGAQRQKLLRSWASAAGRSLPERLGAFLRMQKSRSDPTKRKEQ